MFGLFHWFFCMISHCFFNTIWPLSLSCPRRTHMMGSTEKLSYAQFSLLSLSVKVCLFVCFYSSINHCIKKDFPFPLLWLPNLAKLAHLLTQDIWQQTMAASNRFGDTTVFFSFEPRSRFEDICVQAIGTIFGGRQLQPHKSLLSTILHPHSFKLEQCHPGFCVLIFDANTEWESGTFYSRTESWLKLAVG